MAEVEASHNFAQAEEEVRLVGVDLCLRVADAFPSVLLPPSPTPILLIIICSPFFPLYRPIPSL